LIRHGRDHLHISLYSEQDSALGQIDAFCWSKDDPFAFGSVEGLFSSSLAVSIPFVVPPFLIVGRKES